MEKKTEQLEPVVGMIFGTEIESETKETFYRTVIVLTTNAHLSHHSVLLHLDLHPNQFFTMSERMKMKPEFLCIFGKGRERSDNLNFQVIWNRIN